MRGALVTQFATVFLSGALLAVLCGLVRLAFNHQEPYRKLLLLMNSALFFVGEAYLIGLIGYVIGLHNGIARYDSDAANSISLNIWMFSPNIIMAAFILVCAGLYYIPKKIGMGED